MQAALTVTQNPSPERYRCAVFSTSDATFLEAFMQTRQLCLGEAELACFQVHGSTII